MAVRDDNYTEKFHERLAFCIQYLDHILDGEKDTVEICVVEWDTSTLFQKCNLTGLNNVALKWLHVDSNKAGFAPKKAMHIPLTFNIGIRNTTGRFIGVGPSDNLTSRASMVRLLELFNNPEKYGLGGKEVFMVPRRFLPKRWLDIKKTNEELDQYFNLMTSTNFLFHANRINTMAATGSIIMRRDEWEKCRGLSQLRSGHGGDDVQLLSRITERNTHIDLSNWGIWHFKLPRTGGSRNLSADIKDWDDKYFSVDAQPNPRNWGIVPGISEINVGSQKAEKAYELIETDNGVITNIPTLIRNYQFANHWTRLSKLASIIYKTMKNRKVAVEHLEDLSGLMDVIVRQTKASFLITGINFFEKGSQKIFAQNKDLFALVYFDAKQASDGRAYEEKFVDTITKLIDVSHFGHITTYRRHSLKNLANVSNRFKKFRNGIALFEETSDFEINLTCFFDFFDNITLVVSHRNNKILNDSLKKKFSYVGKYFSWYFYVKS